jgi:hypothetical protein
VQNICYWAQFYKTFLNAQTEIRHSGIGKQRQVKFILALGNTLYYDKAKLDHGGFKDSWGQKD